MNKFDYATEAFFSLAFFANDVNSIFTAQDMRDAATPRADQSGDALTVEEMQANVSAIISASATIGIKISAPRKGYKTLRGLVSWAKKEIEKIRPVYLAEYKANEEKEAAERLETVDCVRCGDPTDAKEAAKTGGRCPSCFAPKAPEPTKPSAIRDFTPAEISAAPEQEALTSCPVCDSSYPLALPCLRFFLSPSTRFPLPLLRGLRWRGLRR